MDKINLNNKIMFWFYFLVLLTVLTYIENYSYYSSKKISDSIEINQLAKYITNSITKCLKFTTEEKCFQELKSELNQNKSYGIIKLSKNNQILFEYNNTKDRHLDRELVVIPKVLQLIDDYNYKLYVAKHSTPNILLSTFKSLTFSITDLGAKVQEYGVKSAFEWYKTEQIFLRSKYTVIYMLLVFAVLLYIRSFQSKIVDNNPQKLAKLLTNFTIDKPIKYTTHVWDFGELQKEYGDFDAYMAGVKKQFEDMKGELKVLSPNLYKKVHTFLLETNPVDKYSWCSKTHINIGWSSLDGLKEWCDSGKNPFDFKLPKSIRIGDEAPLKTFESIVNLFKQEIEIRADFHNLEQIFSKQKIKLGANFNFDISVSKLSRQFYIDTQKFSFAVDKIFIEIIKRKEYPNLEVVTTELDDRSIEIKITQIDSISSRSAEELLQRAKKAGDLADIVSNLQNLCDYSIESTYENTNFKVNFLHSNNVKEIEILAEKPKGFTHILRFYK